MATIKWVADEPHTQVQFRVRHMMVSNVVGEFSKFNIEVESDGMDFTKAKAHFSAPVNSIETKNKQRETHLRSSDFFDAENTPNISFESTGVKKIDDSHYEMTGNLTMRGNTKPVTLSVEKGGVIKDTNGKHRAGFEIEGKLNRKDFGLKYNAVMETGGLVVGDEVKMRVSVELLEV